MIRPQGDEVARHRGVGGGGSGGGRLRVPADRRRRGASGAQARYLDGRAEGPGVRGGAVARVAGSVAVGVRERARLGTDAIDGPLAERHDVQLPVRPILEIGDHAKACAEQDLRHLRRADPRRVVGHPVLQGHRREGQGVARGVRHEAVHLAAVVVAHQQVVQLAAAHQRARREDQRGRGDRNLPGEFRIAVDRPWGHPQIALTLRVARVRSHDLGPAAVEPGDDPVDLIVLGRSVLSVPKAATHRVEGQPERVPDAVGVVPVHRVGGKERVEEGIVGQPRSAGVDAEDDTGVVGGGAVGKILQLAAPVLVADDGVQGAVRSEGEDAAVVVGAGSDRQVEDQGRVDERRPVPGAAVHTVPHRPGDADRVGACRALRQIKIDVPVDGEVRVESDTEQPPLAQRVDADVQDRGRLQDPTDDPAHLPVRLLQHQDVAVPDERHRRRLRQAAGDDLNLKSGVVDRLRRGGERREQQERDADARPPSGGDEESLKHASPSD